jgi:hypothetical protein
VREEVFPALGIDADEVRKSEGVIGTYNVANFANKTAEVFLHQEVDEDLLVAAISLPVLMPAVERKGVAYTDAVWIRDSNVPEALRQGSSEVWLVWCIGNTPVYQRGLFRQYVHMIEMAATGSLLADLRHLEHEPSASGLRIHVIKPSRPIPLDPDYFLGRVDGAALIGMGYRDARAYLADPRPYELPCGPDLTAMAPALPAISAPLRLEGWFSWFEPSPVRRDGPAAIHLRLEGRHIGPAGLEMDAVGDVRIPGWPARHLAERGALHFEPHGGIELELQLPAPAPGYRLRGKSDGDRLALALAEAGAGTEVGTGWLTFGSCELAGLVASLHTSGYSSFLTGWRARCAAAAAIWRGGRRAA